MAKRMKLVPESLYNKFMLQNREEDNHEDTILHGKNRVLNSTELPDDLKVLLFQEMARNLTTKIGNRKKKPVLVKNVSDSSSLEASTAPKLDNAKSPVPGSTVPGLVPDNQKPGPSSAITSRRPIESKQETSIQNFLKANNIKVNEFDEVMINNVPIHMSEYSTIIDILTGANVPKREVIGLSDVLNKLSAVDVPRTLFPAKVRKLYETGGVAVRSSKRLRGKKIPWERVT